MTHRRPRLQPLEPPLHWFEGMFLNPQHLQQLARHTHHALAHHTRLLSPFSWGVHRMRVDEEALLSGNFKILASRGDDLDALLPDGTVIQAGLLSRPLALDLTPHLERLREERNASLKILLAVPDGGPRAVQLEEGEDVGYPLRYRAFPPEDTVDETTGTGATPVTRIKLNAHLAAEGEDLGAFESLPVAEVGYRGDSLVLTDYIPPTTIVTRESRIAAIVTRLCHKLRSRATELAGQFDAALGHRETSKTLESRFQAFGLVANLLPLEQMVELECLHPVQFHLALCRTLGEVSTLGLDLVPPAAPPYDHLDLRRTFGELQRRIDQAIRPTEPNYDQLSVRESKGAYEVLDLRSDHLGRPIFLVARARSGADPDALSRWIERNCTICPRSGVRDHVKTAVPGIDRELMDPPPIDLPVPRGARVYRLDMSREYVDALQRDPKLCLGPTRPLKTLPDGKPLEAPLTLELYVRKLEEAHVW